MQTVLVMIRSDGERRSFSIARDMTVVGRREDCDLRIPLGEISRKHCRLVRDGDVLRLEDLGSSNGTFHNGDRIQESTLAAGDTIQIGPVVFVLQIDGVPADEDLQPVATQAIEGGGTDIGPEVTQPDFVSDGGGDFVQEYAAESEPAAEGDIAEAAADDEVFLTEEQVVPGATEPRAPEGGAAGGAEPRLEAEDFTTLNTPEPPQGELHLESGR